MQKNKINYQHYFKLFLASSLVSIVSILLIYSVKIITEHSEEYFFETAAEGYSWAFIFLPTIGITIIYFLRKYLFNGRKNKGITEIYKTIDQRKEHLPLFKIPSHLINGFLTITFGGSTGIEVSSVVASATAGNFAHKKKFAANIYKRELICAGVTAAVAILFVSPLAGFLFAIEVISRKVKKSLIFACGISALLSWIFIHYMDIQPLLSFENLQWKWDALPFFAVLSLLGAVLSVYFTFMVIKIKSFFGNINNNFLRVNLGAVTVGLLIFFFPVLYGDSYHGMRDFMNAANISLVGLAILILLKPIAASLTLGAGGDGGVFAPSIVAGAFLGLAVAHLGNQLFGLHLIPVNFALVGAAATLSASIHAPFTALILVCSIAPGAFQLFIPVLLGSFCSKYAAKCMLPYNVYTYDFYLQQKSQEKTAGL